MKDDKKKLGPRHRARRRAVEILFEAESRNLGVVEVAEQRAALESTDSEIGTVPQYALTAVRGIVEEQARIDETIISYLQDWTLERLPAVDRSILRLAVWELLCTVDVPPVVAVDEAIELAKELSTDESPGFLNGVLGQIVLIAPQIRAARGATGA